MEKFKQVYNPREDEFDMVNKEDSPLPPSVLPYIKNILLYNPSEAAIP